MGRLTMTSDFNKFNIYKLKYSIKNNKLDNGLDYS